MASAASLNLTVKLDTGLMYPKLACIQEVLDVATPPLHVGIAMGALRALCEIERLSDAARRDLGLREPDSVHAVRLELSGA